MEIIILEDSRQVAVYAAAIIADLLAHKADAVLGLATGETPVATYRELVRRHREGALSFRGATTFNLDEYIGIAPDDPNS